MSATVFGAGTYGTANETATDINLYTASVVMNATSSQAWAPNHVGADVGLSIYNKGCDLSFTGILSVADDLGVVVGEVLQAADIANAAIFATSGNGVTVFYALDGSITRNNAGFQEGSLNVTGRVGLTDTSATTVTDAI